MQPTEHKQYPDDLIDKPLWQKPCARELKNIESLSFKKMKTIVRLLDRYSEQLLSQNRKLHVHKETNADLLDELEDRCEEVSNVNIFLNNTINSISLLEVTDDVVRGSLKRIIGARQVLEVGSLVSEVERRVEELVASGRRAFGSHFGSGCRDFDESDGSVSEGMREVKDEDEGFGDSPVSRVSFLFFFVSFCYSMNILGFGSFLVRI